jgi:hypothetical protein
MSIVFLFFENFGSDWNGVGDFVGVSAIKERVTASD